jgi:cyclophilin family peptidyl-prolyl cis-trans isomerase
MTPRRLATVSALFGAVACTPPPPAATPQRQAPPPPPPVVVSTESPEPVVAKAPPPTAAPEPVVVVPPCERLVAVLHEPPPLRGNHDQRPKALSHLADALEVTARKVRAVQELEPELAAQRDAYAETVQKLATAARGTARGFEQGDPIGAALSGKQMTTHAWKESKLADAIRARCPNDETPAAAAVVAPAAPTAKGPFPQSTHLGMRNPSQAAFRAPAKFRVRFDTTAGVFVASCRRSSAPHGADRFYSLVRIGFYDDVAFFRAVKNFVIQFGMHGDPAVQALWAKRNITPDKVVASNFEGSVTFAQAGGPATPGHTAKSRSTQLFINLKDNTRLDAMGFAPFCVISSGMDAVQRIHTGDGDKAGRDQGKIGAEGNAYLRATYPDLDYIRSARID